MMASAAHTPAQGVPLPAIGLPPMPAVARVLAGFQRDQLASFVEVAIGLLDIADGDADEEDNGDDELTGDEQDAGWTEYHTRGRHKLASGMSESFDEHEDDEDDDPDTGVEDDPRGFDPEEDMAADDLPCDEPDQDLEHEQMQDDVPMLRTVTLDHNVFTDQRQPLGISNLQSSFRVGRDGIMSADSGAVHRPNGASWPGGRGVPV